MMVGDIVRERHFFWGGSSPVRHGMIIDIDPLLRHGRRESPINEIVILLSSGRLLYADPLKWEQIVEE